MQGLLAIGLASICAVWAWRTDDKPVRWFLVGACLLNLLGAFVVSQEGNFWKWAPRDTQDDVDYHRD